MISYEPGTDRQNERSQGRRTRVITAARKEQNRLAQKAFRESAWTCISIVLYLVVSRVLIEHFQVSESKQLA